METQENALLARAEGLVQRPAALAALALDMHHIPHVDDPFFFRVLQNKITTIAKKDQVEIYYLRRHRLALIGQKSAVGGVAQRVRQLSSLLLEHGKASIEVQTFDLSRPDAGLVSYCRRLLDEIAHEEASEEQPSYDGDDNLSRFLVIEQSLHSADLSSLVHEHPIYRFSQTEEPEIVAYELSSAIAELENMFGVSILENPWLFDRVTEILDQRMLYHLVRDRALTKRVMTINIHSNTILSQNFQKFSREAAFDWQNLVIFELPHIEFIDDPDTFYQACGRVHAHHGKVALDGVPWSSLKSLVDQASMFVMVKVPWDDRMRQLSQDQRADVAKLVEAIGRDKCVIFHCDAPDATEIAMELGFRMLEGMDVDTDAATQHRAAVDRRVERMRQESNMDAMLKQEDEKEEKGGWLGFLGGKAKHKKEKPQGEDDDF